MFKKIIEHAIHIISNDTKLVRFSFITSFFHSISVMTMILYSFNNIITSKFDKWVSYTEIFNYVQDDIIIVIIIVAIWFIWYQLIYPIGQATVIHYLHSWQKNIWKSIWKGIEKFFAMFEFNNLLWLFGVITFITTLLRLTYLEILNNFFILILISIWWICVLTAAFIRPYTKYAINIEWLGLYDAIKRSSRLSIQNFGITIKFVILEFFLIFRFIFGTLIIMWVPLLIMYIATNLKLNDTKLTEIIVYITAIWFLFITTYINGIIEAFFATYRYKVYSHLIKIEDWEDGLEYSNTPGKIPETKKQETKQTTPPQQSQNPMGNSR